MRHQQQCRIGTTAIILIREGHHDWPNNLLKIETTATAFKIRHHSRLRGTTVAPDGDIWISASYHATKIYCSPGKKSSVLKAYLTKLLEVAESGELE